MSAFKNDFVEIFPPPNSNIRQWFSWPNDVSQTGASIGRVNSGGFPMDWMHQTSLLVVMRHHTHSPQPSSKVVVISSPSNQRFIISINGFQVLLPHTDGTTMGGIHHQIKLPGRWYSSSVVPLERSKMVAFWLLLAAPQQQPWDICDPCGLRTDYQNRLAPRLPDANIQRL